MHGERDTIGLLTIQEVCPVLVQCYAKTYAGCARFAYGNASWLFTINEGYRHSFN